MKKGFCDGVVLWRGKKGIRRSVRRVKSGIREEYEVFYLVWYSLRWGVRFLVINCGFGEECWERWWRNFKFLLK